jgi:hypothetical protein
MINSNHLDSTISVCNLHVIKGFTEIFYPEEGLAVDITIFN